MQDGRTSNIFQRNT